MTIVWNKLMKREKISEQIRNNQLRLINRSGETTLPHI